MIFHHDGIDEDISIEDFSSMDLERAALYLESAAYAIGPDNSAEGHIGLRMELEQFLGVALRTGIQIDRLKNEGLTPAEVKKSEPVVHNFKYLKETLAPRVIESIRAYEVGHQGSYLDRSGLLAAFVVNGICATLSGRLWHESTGRISANGLLGFDPDGEPAPNSRFPRSMQLSGIAHACQSLREQKGVGRVPAKRTSNLTFD